ncbi:hypothetical protein B0H10DRAFT_2068247 [Mycena sp. CBHHK59/15]|nr:hypothetical protein B0H10DRAFT_2068247 [Mycena sp. CBHHK59/15]
MILELELKRKPLLGHDIAQEFKTTRPQYREWRRSQPPRALHLVYYIPNRRPGDFSPPVYTYSTTASFSCLGLPSARASRVLGDCALPPGPAGAPPHCTPNRRYAYLTAPAAECAETIPMHLILTGATGTVGAPILRHCPAAPSITQLSILSRRPFALPTQRRRA